jgi:hypothetical protein
MGAPLLQRKLRLLERPWPWLAVGTAATAFFVVLVILGTSGALESILDKELLGRELRGYTGTGLALGASAFVMSAIALAYSLRKRAMQERLPFGRATMMTWLWLHVAVGALALVAAVFHGGYGVVSANVSTGKVLFFVFMLLALTGVAWRIVYVTVPPVAAPQIGNYSKAGSQKRAEDQLTEIEKIAAGGSEALHRIKQWLLEAPTDPRPDEVAQATASLSDDERAIVSELQVLAASRRRALRRAALQAKYTRVLQGFRLIHIPLTILFVPLLVLHIVAALEIPARVVPVGAVPFGAFSGFHPSKDCAGCHKSIYEQWTGSMHAHALKSPITIQQNNQLLATEYGKLPAPDPQKVCVNCHAPIATALTGPADLPLERRFYDQDLLSEGVGCTACHQYDGETETPGAMGLSRLQDFFRPGTTYFGQIEDPVGNAFHKSEVNKIYKNPEQLCTNCHDVSYDTNADGKVIKGEDLVLQTTIEEYERYVKAGGSGTCLGCHMPVMQGVDRAADGAGIPFEQDGTAPPREIHDHSFVGVDYPLDGVATSDPQKKARERLLKGAGEIAIDDPLIKGDQLTFAVRLRNSGAGHNLPTGFAFARQLWLEVIVTHGNKELFSSGVLGANEDDLCDASTIDDDKNPTAKRIKGCAKSDPLLVNLQQKLVTKYRIARDDKDEKIVDENTGEFVLDPADDGVETMLQHIAGGVVARIRPFDKKRLGALQPLEERKFGYGIKLPAGTTGKLTISVRLLFRSLPPYLLRELADGQTPGDGVSLNDIIGNIQIVELATDEDSITVQ